MFRKATTSECLAVAILLASGCASHPSPAIPDKPRLSPAVRVIDDTFHSHYVNREMHLRLIVPVAPTPHVKPSVVYMLHGAGTDFHDWTNNSDIAALAARNVVLVFVDAPGSYYIDEASDPHHAYEAYVTSELAWQVYRHYPTASRMRAHIAIVGISRGGYGATVIGLKHPYAYSFIGDVSGALDFPERKFLWRAPGDSLALNRVFGAQGNETRSKNDPFKLIRAMPMGQTPYIYISCGVKDSLFGPNQRFATMLSQLQLAHEFHELPGGHNWETWGAQLPEMESALLAHFDSAPAETYP